MTFSKHIDENIRDDQIIQMYFDRNEEAIVHTKKKYGKLCYSISGNILSDQYDVDECMNDMYIAAWNTIPPQNPSSLKLYVCKLIRRISVNKSIYNNSKKRDKRKTVSYEEIEAELCAIFDDSFADDEFALKEIINDYLSKTSKEKRVVVVLRFWYCMSIKEISEKTGMNVNTVKTILTRELKRMKRFFEKEGFYK